MLRGLGVPPSTRLADALKKDALDLLSLRHPSFVFPERVARGDEQWWCLRRFVEGSPFVDVVHSCPAWQVIELFLSAARALERLHLAGHSHGALRSSNLIVARTRRAGAGVRLLDPALFADDSTNTTNEEVVHTDLRALGLVFYAPLAVAASDRLRSDGDTSLEFGPQVPLDLTRVVTQLANPGAHPFYSSASDLVDDLERLRSRPWQTAIQAPECLFGRDDEITALRRQLANGTPCWVAIAGEAGVGKSALLRRAALEAEVSGYRTVTLPSRTGGNGPSLTDVITHVLPTGARGRSLRAQYRELIESTSAVRDADVDDRNAKQRFLQGSLDVLFAASGGEKTIAFLDDAHLADLLTIEFLGAWIRSIDLLRAGGANPSQATPATLVVAFRSESPFHQRLKTLLDALSNSTCGERIDLENLEHESVERWLAIQGNHRKLDVDSTYAATHGLPLAVRESLLLDGGDEPERLGGTEIETIHRAYVAGLEETERDVLEALALFGRPASREVLAALCHGAGRRLGTAIQALVDDGAVESEAHQVRLRHASLASWVRESLSDEQRRRLHRLMATTLERLHDESIEDIAHHWLHSGILDSASPDGAAAGEAAGVILKAARRLAAHHDGRRALVYYSALLRSSSPTHEPLRELALEAASAHARCSEHRQGALLLREHLSDHDDAGRFHARIGFYLHRAGDVEDAESHLLNARSLLSARTSSAARLEAIRTEAQLAEMAIHRGEYDRAEAICRETLERFGGTSSDQTFCREKMILVENLALVRLRRLEYSAARKLFEESLLLGESIDVFAEKSLILNNLGTLHSQLNRFTDAIDCYERAAALSAKLGDDQNLSIIYSNLAVLQAKVGDGDAAALSLKRAAAHDLRCASNRNRYLRLHSAAVVDLLFGRYASAAEGFRSAVVLGEKLRDHFMLAFQWVFLGECRLFRGETKAAMQAFERARSESSSQPVEALIESMVLAREKFVFRLPSRRPKRRGEREDSHGS